MVSRCHSICSVPAIIMSRSPLSSLLWYRQFVGLSRPHQVHLSVQCGILYEEFPCILIDGEHGSGPCWFLASDLVMDLRVDAPLLIIIFPNDLHDFCAWCFTGQGAMGEDIVRHVIPRARGSLYVFLDLLNTVWYIGWCPIWLCSTNENRVSVLYEGIWRQVV